jgi:hypothetical protein
MRFTSMTRANSCGVVCSKVAKSYRGQMHPSVESPVLLYGPVGDRFHLLELRSVGGNGDSLAALVPYLLYQGVEALLAPSRGHDLRALPCEPDGGLAAYAAGGAH